MTKTFKTDVERNSYFTHLANVSGTPDTIKYIDGLLYKNNEIITDKLFIGHMENMFDSLAKLSQLDQERVCGQ
jgi:hypothetical protein